MIHSYNVKIDDTILTKMTSVATFLVWLQALYWVRLSSEMSFYVRIVFQSLTDILYFLVMLCLIVASFANALFIIDRS